MEFGVVPPVIRGLMIVVRDQVGLVEVLTQGDWSEEGRRFYPVALCPGGHN